MYYFKYDDLVIYKYIVNFDKNRMLSLRSNIINNCSELVHREVDSDIEINSSMRIRNLKQNKIGDMYHYSYDEYVYPHLVSLIDMLLKNDITSLERILDLNTKKNDVNKIQDEGKKNKLMIYYDRVIDIISFDLMDKINFETTRPKTKRRLKRA